MARPSRAAVAAEDAAMIERQRHYRLAADKMAQQLAQHGAVQRVALIGSVARPLWREVSPYPPFRTYRIETVHRCKDLDLAVWVSALDGLDELRRARGAVSRQVLEQANIGIPVHDIELFLIEPGTDRYLGRLCYFKACTVGKRECLAAGCGAHPFLKQMDGFTFWPETLDPSGMVILFDRAVGVVGSAAALPSVVEDAQPMIDVTVKIPKHRRLELESLAARWRGEE